jgi:outer membrane PBP1 activator LpoA protein
MHYHIRVKGHLGVSWQPWFAGLQITREAAGTTLLSGPLPDQAALYAMLLKINRLGLTLLALESSDAQHDTSDAAELTLAPRDITYEH